MPKRCILFTDIKKSSTLWAEHHDLMPAALKKHEKQITKLCSEYGGFIVKSIGDAYMIMIPTLKKCIDFCIALAKIQIDDPIKLKKDYLRVRVGFSYGTPIKRFVTIQNNKLLDFFGHAVNSASRMESKVSDVGGFAFTIIGKNTIDKDVIKYLTTKRVDVSMIQFSKTCKEKISRSVRLFNSEQIASISCEDENTLHGVGSLLVYKCNLI